MLCFCHTLDFFTFHQTFVKIERSFLLTWALFLFLSSALLYLNGDFEGGEFIFTEMDAKTVTVRHFSSVPSRK